jgi:hypothetical protein
MKEYIFQHTKHGEKFILKRFTIKGLLRSVRSVCIPAHSHSLYCLAHCLTDSLKWERIVEHRQHLTESIWQYRIYIISDRLYSCEICFLSLPIPLTRKSNISALYHLAFFSVTHCRICFEHVKLCFILLLELRIDPSCLSVSNNVVSEVSALTAKA